MTAKNTLLWGTNLRIRSTAEEGALDSVCLASKKVFRWNRDGTIAVVVRPSRSIKSDAMVKQLAQNTQG